MENHTIVYTREIFKFFSSELFAQTIMVPHKSHEFEKGLEKKLEVVVSGKIVSLSKSSSLTAILVVFLD